MHPPPAAAAASTARENAIRYIDVMCLSLKQVTADHCETRSSATSGDVAGTRAVQAARGMINLIAPRDRRIQGLALITPRSGEVRASWRRRRRGYAGAVPEALRARVCIEPRGRLQLHAGRPAPGRVVVADGVIPGGASDMLPARDPAGEPASGRAQVVRDRARQTRAAVQRGVRGGRAVELAVVIPHTAESGYRRGAAWTGGPRRRWRREAD